LANLESSLRNAEPDIVIGDLPTLEGYAAVHLIQIFQNLLSNALKYRSTDQKCRIEINAKRIDDMWQFSIYDNGIGIDKRYQERIFGLFKRLHGREYEGTGIGLAICRRVINFYKGNIWVDSEPGAGTTFYVELPIRTPPG
jgi:signal transduction histidine kinase